MPPPDSRLVADLLLHHAEGRSTGVLTLLRGQVRKQLFLHDGALVSAESNLREEALGELLVALGLLDKGRLSQLLAEVKKRGQKMGSVLIELGWASPDQVLAALAEQVRRRAVSALRWPETEASFEASTAFVGHVIEHRFELPTLVLAGLRDSSAFDQLLPYLDREGTPLVRLGARFERHRNAFVNTFGPALPTLLFEPAELGALVLRPDASTLVGGLEGLLSSGLGELIEAGSVVAVASTEESGRALQEMWQAPDTLSEGRALAPDEPVLPGVNASGPATPPPFLDALEGGIPEDLMREYLQMHDLPPHELLGLPEHAAPLAVTAAYTAKCDRIAGLGTEVRGGVYGQKLHELIEAYERAHVTLTNPTLPGVERHAGLPSLPKTLSDMDPLGAELAFNDGRALLAAGRNEAGLAQLKLAVARRPDQAAYHAWLGWALFLVQGDAALPEAQDRLDHAVAVDPDSVDGHALLGGLLVALGEGGRARPHLERTLALKPDQREALELLTRLYLDANEGEQAEKLYRRLLTALGDREPSFRSRLWRDLGELYERTLGDPAGAAKSYALASSLAPADSALRARAQAAARRAPRV